MKYFIAIVAIISLNLLVNHMPESSDILVADIVTVQHLFEPKDTEIYLEGIPIPVRLYPFGEVAAHDTAGRAGFVIFVEPEQHVYQSDNLLRITPNFDTPQHLPDNFMEIIQIANITVDEAESYIKAAFDINSYRYSFYTAPTEAFPFSIIEFYDGIEFDSKSTRILIKDNNHNGVFVITVQNSVESVAFWVRCKHYIGTLSIIG